MNNDTKIMKTAACCIAGAGAALVLSGVMLFAGDMLHWSIDIAIAIAGGAMIMGGGFIEMFACAIEERRRRHGRRKNLRK